MEQSDESHLKSGSLQKLTRLLFVVLVCSLLPPFGFYSIIGAALSNSQLIGGEFQWGWFFLGIGFIFGAPMLLGLSLRPDGRGIRSGFLGIGWAFIVWVIGISQVTGFLENWFPGFNSFYVTVVLFIVGTVSIVSTFAGWVKSKIEFTGLILGLIIGCILSILFGRTSSSLMWSGFGPFIISFPFVWLSVIFFPELLSKRTDWRGILVWLLMMTIPVVLAFLLSS